MTDGPWPPPTGGGHQPPHQPAAEPPAGGWAPPVGGQQPSQGWPQPGRGSEGAQPSAGWHRPPQPGGLMLRTGFFPLAFLLHFFPPKVSIDGSAPFDLRWGENPLPGVPPGPHRVRVWFTYLFFGECGVADAVVEVPHDGTFLEYRAPLFVWSPGKFPSLAHQGAPVASVAAAEAGAWHPDPLGRAEQRWWDGRQWTGHVLRGGQPGWDPV